MMLVESKTGEKLNFLETGTERIYILDHVAFEGQFDEEDNNDWEKSSGKKLLQEWAKKNLPDEILEQFEVDIPAVDEVFSQEMFNWWVDDSTKGIVSKQFPIFKDSDERMKKLDGNHIWWWWTRSANADLDDYVWCVNPDGSMSYYLAGNTFGFVPVLRRK